MVKSEDNLSLYDILGVAKDATQKEIKFAYKNKAKETHPDTESGSDELFKKVNDAYDILSDEERRQKYDENGQTETINREEEVINFLVQTIVPAIMTAEDIKHTDLLDGVRQYVENLLFGLPKRERSLRDQIQKLESVEKRIKRKEDGKNIFSQVLHGSITGLYKQIDHIEMDKELYTNSLILLSKYEYVLDDIISFDKKDYGNSGDKKGIFGTKRKGIA